MDGSDHLYRINQGESNYPVGGLQGWKTDWKYEGGYKERNVLIVTPKLKVSEWTPGHNMIL